MSESKTTPNEMSVYLISRGWALDTATSAWKRPHFSMIPMCIEKAYEFEKWREANPASDPPRWGAEPISQPHENGPKTTPAQLVAHAAEQTFRQIKQLNKNLACAITGQQRRDIQAEIVAAKADWWDRVREHFV